MVRQSRQNHDNLHPEGIRNRSGLAERRPAGIQTGRLNEKLALFSRTATFNELMGWLAHELNQPLAAILGNAQAALHLIERGNPDLKELREIFTDIVSNDQRAAGEIRRIQSMLEKCSIERTSLLLNDLIEEIMPVVQDDPRARDVSIDLDFGLSLPAITGDRIQLQQAILNLVVNALESMNASGRPGKLTLRTRQADGEVVLDVADSGNGLPNGKLDPLFEPLVTTKAGTLGMGLPLSRSIIMKHNGRLWAENNVDGGATFHVALPVKNNLRSEPTTELDRNSPSDSGPRSRRALVLIADDGAAFRRAVASILSEFPELYHLAEAADGAEAVKMAAELNPDLVLLDIGLPIVNGVEAAARIRAVTPNAKLVFLTQHDSPDFVDAAMRTGALGYVLKLDVGNELMQAVTAVVRGEQYFSSGIRR